MTWDGNIPVDFESDFVQASPPPEPSPVRAVAFLLYLAALVLLLCAPALVLLVWRAAL